ncbi:MAG TPA: hypothetical protein VLA62_04770 [Solirubrobacterales bacterium]|nr:hypothetical protein [Solirubrobacterales bacterium]
MTAVVVSEDDAPYVRAVIVRLRSNGEYDPSFSGNGWKKVLRRDSALLSIASAPHGRLVGAGRVGDSMLATRVKESGAFDRSFAGDGVKRTKLGVRHGHAVAQDVMVQRNRKPLIAATFEIPFQKHGVILARLRPNGDFDDSFSRDGKRTYRKLSRDLPAFWDAGMQANGKILLTGHPGGSSRKAYVARLENHGRPFVAP